MPKCCRAACHGHEQAKWAISRGYFPNKTHQNELQSAPFNTGLQRQTVDCACPTAETGEGLYNTSPCPVCVCVCVIVCLCACLRVCARARARVCGTSVAFLVLGARATGDITKGTCLFKYLCEWGEVSGLGLAPCRVSPPEGVGLLYVQACRLGHTVQQWYPLPCA